MKLYKRFSQSSCFFIILALLLCTGVCGGSVNATTLTIQSDAPLDIEPHGFDGLAEQSLFKGKLPKGENSIEVRYHQGLALLVFSADQALVLIDRAPVRLNFDTPYR